MLGNTHGKTQPLPLRGVGGEGPTTPRSGSTHETTTLGQNPFTTRGRSTNRPAGQPNAYSPRFIEE